MLNSQMRHADPPIASVKALLIVLSRDPQRFSAPVDNSVAELGTKLWILWINSRRDGHDRRGSDPSIRQEAKTPYARKRLRRLRRRSLPLIFFNSSSVVRSDEPSSFAASS